MCIPDTPDLATSTRFLEKPKLVRLRGRPHITGQLGLWLFLDCNTFLSQTFAASGGMLNLIAASLGAGDGGNVLQSFMFPISESGTRIDSRAGRLGKAISHSNGPATRQAHE
jgi:hypothetical protein